MPVNPKSLSNREELNLRQGIKSSLPNMKQLIAAIYTLFKISKKSDLNYSEEYEESKKSAIKLREELNQPLFDFFQKQLYSASMTEDILLYSFNKTPLFCSQLEPLQVAIQLFWKLGEINFVEDMASSTERTGGQRYNKKIIFSTNLDIIDNVISDEKGQIREESKNLLFNYITGANLEINNIDRKLIKLLTIFSEETQFKIRDEFSNEILFQLEGIYSELITDNTVKNKDKIEDVGPFRILKRTVKEDLNYFIESDKKVGFKLKGNVSKENLENYLIRVNSYLNLSPKTTNIEISEETVVFSQKKFPTIQKIFYGAPGTGKSHRVKEITKGKEKRTERVTFHPEYDYASFVGGYKPTMEEDENGNEIIKYKFVPQVFTNIYVEAWKNPEDDYFLVIEEINRGNCAEIFGDIFQLLDRNANYKVTPSEEMKKHLISKLGEVKHAKKLSLPPNLNILATMNTSDQSLFPMDSAFKRRWDWEYIPICYEEYYKEGEKNRSSQFRVELSIDESFSWLEFIEKVNVRIKNNPNLGMDKCIGNYFINSDNDRISLDTFINKAIFYLWNDVFKDEGDNENIFENRTTYEDFFPIESNGKVKVEEILRLLEVDIEITEQSTESE